MCGCTHQIIAALQIERRNLASREILGLLLEGALGNCYMATLLGHAWAELKVSARRLNISFTWLVEIEMGEISSCSMLARADKQLSCS